MITTPFPQRESLQTALATILSFALTIEHMRHQEKKLIPSGTTGRSVSPSQAKATYSETYSRGDYDDTLAEAVNISSESPYPSQDIQLPPACRR